MARLGGFRISCRSKVVSLRWRVIAVAAMVLSSVSIVGNALRLRVAKAASTFGSPFFPIEPMQGVDTRVLTIREASAARCGRGR